MKILSMNIRGFNQDGKQGWFKQLIHDAKPIIAAVQETKRKNFSDLWIENVWGSQCVKYAVKESVGRSGGLLMIWDASIFHVDRAVEGEFFIGIKSDMKKKRFWDSLNELLSYDNAAWFFCGEFNEVKNINERENTNFISRRTSRFNSFINDNGLIEIPLSGRKFTRISDEGLQFSILVHFLVSDNFAFLWNDLSVTALDRKLLDHTPILLKNGQFDSGPKPTRVFDSWLDTDGAAQIISDASKLPIAPCRPDTTFRLKLKNVKSKLKNWSSLSFGKLDSKIKHLNELCNFWDVEAKKRVLTDTEIHEWLNNRNSWIEKDHVKRNMLKQKARIKWAVEGDENSKYFHSIIKRKCNKNNIRGLHINGSWQENLDDIKYEVFRHFKSFYEDPNVSGFDFDDFETSKISQEDASSLELPFIEEELWLAIKDCGVTKVPGPDCFNFYFYHKFWDLIKEYL
ncbi:uncharacterized protein [Rutidosis leptorrhynchoides]|uniref:uncharacterized protein n=1 Tax=Rutidosis leptorrhynchoides TaxID=125765 RepID=UPI003A98D313